MAKHVPHTEYPGPEKSPKKAKEPSVEGLLDSSETMLVVEDAKTHVKNLNPQEAIDKQLEYWSSDKVEEVIREKWNEKVTVNFDDDSKLVKSKWKQKTVELKENEMKKAGVNEARKKKQQEDNLSTVSVLSQDSTVLGIVDSQKQALIQSIKDLEKKERVRQNWMDKARSKARMDELEARYVKERERDNEKLDQLIRDYSALKTHSSKGTYDTISKSRVENRPSQWNQLQTMDADRFVGLKNHSQQIFHRARIEKFESTDRRAQARFNAKSYDHYEEKRKAILLREKRDILVDMVKIAQHEYYEHRAANGGGGGGDQGNLSSLAYYPTPSRNSDTRSVASGASWATFASKDSARSSRPSSNRPKNVPRLSIPKSR
jgi:hypothetical protein